MSCDYSHTPTTETTMLTGKAPITTVEVVGAVSKTPMISKTPPKCIFQPKIYNNQYESNGIRTDESSQSFDDQLVDILTKMTEFDPPSLCGSPSSDLLLRSRSTAPLPSFPVYYFRTSPFLTITSTV
jgi:hypothetical protein